MALTVAFAKGPAVEGDLSYVVAQITWDNSYPTGGLALTPAQVGLSKILFSVDGGVTNAGSAGMVSTSYDVANSKLLAFGGAAAGSKHGEVTNATDLSAVTSRVVFFGYK